MFIKMFINMFKIKATKIKSFPKERRIGSRIRLKEEVVMPHITFPKGHKFTIYNDSEFRGWDLVDDNGNKLDETAMINHLLETI